MNPLKGEVGSSFELSWDVNTKEDPCLFNTCSEVQTCEPDASERGYKCNCNDLTFNGWGDNGPQVKTIKMIEQLIEDPSTKAFYNRTICVPLHQSVDNPTGIQLKTSKNSSITDDVFPYAIIYEFFKVKIWFQLRLSWKTFILKFYIEGKTKNVTNISSHQLLAKFQAQKICWKGMLWKRNENSSNQLLQATCLSID